MNDTAKSAGALDAGKARVAAAAATLLSLAATVAAVIGLIICLTGAEGYSLSAVAYLVLLVAFAALGLIGGVQLLRGQEGAQQMLLVYWLAVLVATTAIAFGALLWGLPEGLVEGGEAAAKKMLAIAVGIWLLGLVPGGGVVALLVRASDRSTRQRYASMVIVSIAVAVALLAAVNLLSQKIHYHGSWEMLGRYSLSERTKKILDVEDKIKLTCVYTSADEAKQTDDLRPRVLELLEDIRIAGREVTVENVTTDAGKAKLLTRLRGELGSRADKHDKFIRDFKTNTPELLTALEQERQEWEAHPKDSYLNMWAVPVEIANTFQVHAEKLEQTRKKVEAGLAGAGLPDYADLARQIEDVVKPFKEDLEKHVKSVADLEAVSKAVAEGDRSKVTLAAADQCVTIAKEMAEIIGKPGSPEADKPSETLAKFVATARRTVQLLAAAAGQLDNVAGDANSDLLLGNRFFSVQVSGPLGPMRISLSDYLRRAVAPSVLDEADEAEGIAKNATAEFQKKFIVSARPRAAGIAKSVEQARQAIADVLTKLAAVDARSKTEFKLAADKKLFEKTLAALSAILDEHGKLPELKDNSLSSDITGENIVIVEVGGKAEVVSFDTVWPLKVSPMGMSAPDSEPRKRNFNGDSAISSKILSMTERPFATVLLTHWGPPPGMPPQMRQMIPPADIPAQALGTIRQRLEEANFEVKDWNLNDEMPEADKGEDGKERPQLLIVLPPPPPAQQNPFQRQPMPTPSFTPEHAAKVTGAIGSGTPAIFLTTFSPPRRSNPFMPAMQAPYAYGDYLRGEWGIDVMTGFLVVPAVTDDQNPGRYKVDGQRFGYLPLSAFSDHPIGKPLQAQRVLWTNLCPIRAATDARGEAKDPPAGVKLEPLLSVPAHWQSTWATRRIQELLAQFRTAEGSYIWPDYLAGDIRVPFDLGVAATREAGADPNSAGTRIVVLSVGASLTDGYLDREVAVREAKGTISLTDPPRANGDFLVNSAYWLVGKQNLIASGPVQATMKEIPPAMKIALVLIYCGLLPVLVLGAGGVVMMRRRR